MPVSITSLNANDQITNSRGVINTNFTNGKNATETLEGTVGTIGTDLDTLENTVTDLDTDVGTLNDTVSGLGGSSAYLGLDLFIPAISSLTWVNQGGATASEDDSVFTLHCPAQSSDNGRVLASSLTGSGYEFVVGCLIGMHPNNYSSCGVVLRNSTTGTIVLYTISNDGGLSVSRWNSLSSFASNQVQLPYGAIGKAIFLRVTDATGSRVFSVSFDGRAYMDIHTEANNVWVGAPGGGACDQIGVFANTNNSSISPSTITVFHFKLDVLPG